MALESGAAPRAPRWHPAPRAAAAGSRRWWRLRPVTSPQAGPVSPPAGAGLGRRPEAWGTAGYGETLAGMPREKGLYISYTLPHFVEFQDDGSPRGLWLLVRVCGKVPDPGEHGLSRDAEEKRDAVHGHPTQIP